jgi:methylmalonyl-CoA mutase
MESFFDKVVDPAAGSYYIEKLTDALAESAWTQFQEIESGGGFGI